jgi:methyl-accepting chemotaxis protein
VGYTTRRLFVEPVFQARFALTLAMVALIAMAIAAFVVLGFLIVPSSAALADASKRLAEQSMLQARLVDIMSDPAVPASQRLSLAQAEALRATELIQDSAVQIREAAEKQSSVSIPLLGVALALVFALAAGYAWARRIVGTEIGIVRWLEAMANGDLSGDFALRKYDELHFLRRGILKVFDELRSLTKRDQRLIEEIVETVEQICVAVKNEPGLSDEGKATLELAVTKVRELHRLHARYRY